MRAPAVAALQCALLSNTRASAQTWHKPIKVVAEDRFTVTTPAGTGAVPIYVSADWSHPLPGIRRVVIIVHGVDRDADVYIRVARHALNASGTAEQATLLIAPQFLADVDVRTYQPPQTVLHWDPGNCASGQPAHGAAPFSTFDVFDSML